MAEINLAGIKGHSRQLNYISKLAQSDSRPHAFLFSGPAGIGKRLVAERFLGSVFCKSSVSPCFDCDICRQIRSGSYPDYFALLKDDKGKIPVGEREKPVSGSVRWLIEKLGRSSISGNYAIIIDGVDTISETGQNALLKTIEEPPSGTTFVLVAESSSLILPTIVSRCLEITFNPLADDDVFDIIKSIYPDSEKNRVIAALAGGSAGNAVYLHGDRVLEEVFELCRSMANYIKGNDRYLNLPNSINEKGNEILLTVIINVFSYMLKEKYTQGIKLLPGDLYIEEEENLRDIIKILLKVKKGLNNNLNVKNSLKGMLYSFPVYG